MKCRNDHVFFRFFFIVVLHFADHAMLTFLANKDEYSVEFELSLAYSFIYYHIVQIWYTRKGNFVESGTTALKITNASVPYLCSYLRLRNDLYCVEWGVKLYSLTHYAATFTQMCIAVTGRRPLCVTSSS